METGGERLKRGLKIAVTGKGGVGKTTVAATLAHVLRGRGYRVLAVDADPDANLAAALGVPRQEAVGIVPIAEMKELIAERTGAQPGTMGGFFKMNPRVDDLPDELSLEVDGVRLMVMGTVKRAAGGCVCPESVLLRNLVTHLLVGRGEAIILDMEAGIEHLGRATAQGVDAMVVVVEPGVRSVRTAQAIAHLAEELAIRRVFVVSNKVDYSRAAALELLLADFEVLGTLPYSEAVARSDLEEVSVHGHAPEFLAAVEGVVDELEARLAGA